MSDHQQDEKLDAPNAGSRPLSTDGLTLSDAQHTPARSTGRAVLLVLTCTLGMMVNSANATAVSISLPRIGASLHIEEAQLQWLVSAYSLSSGCLLIFFGRLADLHGRRRAFLLGTFVQTAFGLGCGFAKDEITIDILRGLQGAGAAATIPASLGILAHAFPPSRARSLAFATFSAGAPVGAALGMVIGGVLTQVTKPTWRSGFYLTAGLGVLGMLGGLLSMDADRPEDSTEADRRVDWLGAFLITAGLTFVIFVLSDGEVAPDGWKTPYIIALLILGVLFTAIFFFWQRRLERVSERAIKPVKWSPPPLMKPSLWSRANGKLAVMMFVAFLNWSCFIAWQFWAQLYYQDYAGLTPILTMVRFLPMFVTGTLANVVVGMVVGRVDFCYLTVVGTLCTGCSALFFALIDTHGTYWAYGFPSAIFSVIGADFVFAAGTLFVAKVAAPHEQSLAGALFQTMTQLGTSFGLTISTIVFNRVFAKEAENGENKAALLKGYRAAQWACFAFGMLATLLAIVFLRGVGIVGHAHPAKKAIVDDPEPASGVSRSASIPAGTAAGVLQTEEDGKKSVRNAEAA